MGYGAVLKHILRFLREQSWVHPLAPKISIQQEWWLRHEARYSTQTSIHPSIHPKSNVYNSSIMYNPFTAYPARKQDCVENPASLHPLAHMASMTKGQCRSVSAFLTPLSQGLPTYHLTMVLGLKSPAPGFLPARLPPAHLL